MPICSSNPDFQKRPFVEASPALPAVSRFDSFKNVLHY
jgi:hypothetical protein